MVNKSFDKGDLIVILMTQDIANFNFKLIINYCKTNHNIMWKDKGLQLVMLPSEDNTISTQFKEEKKYSRGEVEELCGEAFDAGEAYRTGSCEGFKQIHPNKYEWIKENLK